MKNDGGVRLEAARLATQIGGLSNMDAESAILGGCLIYRGLAEEVSQVITHEDFHSPEHQVIYEAICSLTRAGKIPDLIAVTEELLARKSTVSPVYLSEVATCSASRAAAIHHARIVRDLSARRRIAALAYRSLEGAFDRGVSTPDLLRGLVGASEGVLADTDVVRAVSPADAIPGFLSRLDDRRHGRATLGVQTRFTMINRMLGGIVPGDQTIIAARPGMGKTALALNIVDDISKAGIPVGVMSLEMPVDQLLGRHFASGCAIDGMRIRNGSVSNDEWDHIIRHSEEFKNRPIRYFDGSTARPSHLRIMVQRWKREMGLKVLVIDYLQLMRADVRDNNREREISEISGACKRMAVEFGIGVVLLCQLNRLADREDHPKLSHLRESGSIEQDADSVIFIRNWEHGQALTTVELDVAKNRHGATGTFQLAYVNKCLRFENYDPNRKENEAPEYM